MASKSKNVTLKSSDGESFVVEERVAHESQMIKNMIEDDCANEVIPLPNVTGEILSKIIEYCKMHVNGDAADKLKAWDADFIDVDQTTLYDLILASNFLNIKGLLDLTCQKVEDMIKGKSPEEIRTTFKIKNDFTPEEYEAITKENAWAFS